MKADEIYAIDFSSDHEMVRADGPFDHLTKARTAVREMMARRTSPEQVIRIVLVQVRDVMEFEPRVVYRERSGNGQAAPLATDAGEAIEGTDEAAPSIMAATGGWTATLLPLDVEEAAGDAS